MNKTKLVMIGGPSRAGKNSFTDALQERIEKKGNIVKRLSFATTLKQDCAAEILDAYGFNSFSQETKEKDIFRHILIERAQENRAATQNSYYANIIREQIRQLSGVDYVLIDDLRHNESPEDELSLSKDQSSLVVYVNPTWDIKINDAEKASLPKVLRDSDWQVNWPKCKDYEDKEKFALFISPFLTNFMNYFTYVEPFFKP